MQTINDAATKIQKVVKGRNVRKSIDKKHKSATLIQKMIRGWSTRRSLRKSKKQK